MKISLNKIKGAAAIWTSCTMLFTFIFAIVKDKSGQGMSIEQALIAGSIMTTIFGLFIWGLFYGIGKLSDI